MGAFAWSPQFLGGSGGGGTVGDLTESVSSVLTITGGTGATLQNCSIEVDQADAANDGYLSSADWNTFNSKLDGTKANLTETTSSILTITGGTDAVLGSGTTIEVAQADTTTSGYLSSTDWNTFNNKQDTITSGDLTEATSAILTITGGTDSVLGSGVSIEVSQADTTTDGYLSSTDWNTFNNKQDTISSGDLTEATSSILTITGGTDAVLGSGASIEVAQSDTTTDGYLSSTDWNTFNGKLDGTKANLTETTSSVLTITGGTDAVLGSGTTIEVSQADTTTDGYLSSTDWNTFNNKQDTISTGNLTEATSSVLTITGGTDAVLGAGASIEVAQADTTTDGYLSSTDWNTFNGKQDTISTGNLTETTSSVLTITGGTDAVLGSGASIEVAQASTSTDGYLSSTDWNTFNNKGAGDPSWQMEDAGSNQITFKAGSRIVNGIVESVASDVTTNATAVAITNDTLTTLDASNGMLYVASASVRVFTFYDIINDEFVGIGNSTESSDYTWDYRNENVNFDINLSQYVPLGYVDVAASGSPGTLTFTITNWPVQAWTTFNNTAALEPMQDNPNTLTITPSGSMTITSTTITRNQYRRGPDFVEWEFTFTGTVGGTLSNAIDITGFPIAPASIYTATTYAVGDVQFRDGDNGFHSADVVLVDTGTPKLQIFRSDLVNFTAGANLRVNANIRYQIPEADGFNPITVGFPSLSNLVQSANLSADVTTDSTMTDLTINLEIGKTYEVYMNIAFEVDGDNSIVVNAVHDGNTIGVAQVGTAAAAADFFRITKYVQPFVATATTITFDAASLTAGNSIRGDGTDSETHVVVKEVPQSGVGVLVEQAGTGRGGIVKYYNEATVDLTSSGDFTAGTLKVTRINDQVNITATAAPTFASAVSADSATGAIPSWARPSTTKLNIIATTSTRVWQVRIQTDGLFQILARDWAGNGATATNDGGSVTCISYNV